MSRGKQPRPPAKVPNDRLSGKRSEKALQVGKVNRSSNLLIDACVAMIGANVGRRVALNSGRVRVSPRGAGRSRKRGKVVLA